MTDPRQPDVVCLSANDWTGLPTSKQHLMSILARSGRVLYVDPPLDLASVVGRPRRWAKLRGLRRAPGGPWVLSPIELAHRSGPDARAGFFRRAAPRIRAAARRAGIHDPVVWAFSPEHVACAGLLHDALLVYHAADDPAAMSRCPTETAAMERRMLAAADLVFVSSQALLEARAGSGNVHRLPNAADRVHYADVLCGDASATVEALLAAAARPTRRPPELRGVDRPVLLYGGAVYGWFDAELFLALAAARPGWLFVLVGPVAGPLRSASLPPNVLCAGRKSYTEFPWYVAAADAAIMPWRDGPITQHADPIMLYEYLLCGKPVVATPFPAALERGALVRTASGPDAFAAAIEDAVAEPRGSAAAAARARFGFANTWEDRAARALSLIDASLRAKPGSPGGRA